jgi:hypothetical protein
MNYFLCPAYIHTYLLAFAVSILHIYSFFSTKNFCQYMASIRIDYFFSILIQLITVIASRTYTLRKVCLEFPNFPFVAYRIYVTEGALASGGSIMQPLGQTEPF